MTSGRSSPVSLISPPGLAFNAQLLCPELGRVYGTRGMFRGESLQGRPSPEPSDSASTVASDSSPREALLMGPGQPTWISPPPQHEVSETQDSDFLLSAAPIDHVLRLPESFRFPSLRCSPWKPVSPLGCPGALLNLSLQLKKSMSSLRNGPISQSIRGWGGGGPGNIKIPVWPPESCCLSLGLIVKNSWLFSKEKKCLNCFPLCKRSLF